MWRDSETVDEDSRGGPRERSLAGLSEAERDLALERYRILRPFLRDGAPLGSLAEEYGISVRTLRR